MKRDFEKDKRIRRIARILFFVVVLVVPVTMVAIKYDMYKEMNGYKLTTIGLLIISVLFYRFRTAVIDWVDKWEYSAFKHIILGLNRVIVPILIFVIIRVAQREMSTLLFVIEWVMITSIIGYTMIMPVEKHFDFHVKRELRKQEMREVRDE